ncbi:hypothetical protein ES692_12470 [Psychroserpens burtonensis]|uniref:Uncharacterized protein n=2 Tax=Psychroserpens burtonensis TaxID=49278 RepID=A0A5C7B6X7_9FLAO|nr:hypothetical protein [Psychroserpens burtonensis]TXE16584.1 hypothetical protein ES692_12470 [Psychroserpens burtonensis]
MNTQCDDDDFDYVPCDQTVVVDDAFFESAQTHEYEFDSLEISDSCLFVNISASGCDGNSWSMVLVASDDIGDSFPEQRYLKLVLTNDEVCLAIVSQGRSFDLTTIQVGGSNEIILNIEGFPESLTYTY